MKAVWWLPTLSTHNWGTLPIRKAVPLKIRQLRGAAAVRNGQIEGNGLSLTSERDRGVPHRERDGVLQA